MEEALREPGLPFFIERREDTPDRASPNSAGGITWVEVAADRDALETHLGGAHLPVRVVEGPPGVHAVGIGDRELRTS